MALVEDGALLGSRRLDMGNVGSYTIRPYLRRRWDAVGRKFALPAESGARDDLRAWRRRATRKLRGLLASARWNERRWSQRSRKSWNFEDYTRQRVEIQTEPGVVMPMYVLIPKEYTPPYSAVIAAHGHGSAGKLGVAGVRATPELAESIDAYNWAYGLELVRAGFLTFCPDARGHGERREPDAGADIMSSSCEVINHAAHPLGQTVTGMWTWDIHRLIDYVELRPDIRANCIGCVGLSGGGLQTLWALPWMLEYGAPW